MTRAAGYPPYDTPKPVGPGLWIVDGEPIRAMGVVVPVRMTVARLAGGELWLHSPTRVSAPLLDALADLGPVRHLVAPSLGHWTFLADWQERCPDAVTWAAPNLRRRPQVRRSKVRIDRDLGEEAPSEWASELWQTVVPGFGGFREVAFLHRPSRTLILTDLISSIEPDRSPFLTRAYARAMAATAPGSTPQYLRLSLRLRRRAAATAASRLVDWAPERVVFAHGRWFESDGTGRLRRALGWLIG